MKIGVLGLQGDFREHIQLLQKLDVDVVDVRLPEDLEGTSGLVIPGGETTTLRKLLRFSELDQAIIDRAKDGYGLFGTCAGMILLSSQIVNDEKTEPLKLIDITVSRNAYGRQIDSFETDVEIKDIGNFHAIFIRAPQMVSLGEGVESLCDHDDVTILARQKNILAGSFHPEINGDPRIHQYFVEQICRQPQQLAAS